MKLAILTFAQPVTIYGGRDVGGGEARQDMRESSFRAADGWELEMLEGETFGVFRIGREGMSTPVFVGGYGYSFAPMPTPAPVVDAPKRKR